MNQPIPLTKRGMSLREIKNLRNMFEKHYYDGQGTFHAEISSYPLHYLEKRGRWEEIKTDIEDFNRWEFSKGVLSNTFKVYFGDNTSDNKHLVGIERTDGEKEQWITFKLKDSTPSDMRCEGSSCTFKNCYTDVDVEYIVLEGMLKENIILRQKNDKRKFRFTIKTGNVSIQKEGDSIVIYDLDGHVIWDMGKPYLIDSEGVISYGVHYDLVYGASFNEMTLIVTDEDFLRKAAYPVMIDPTVELQGDSAIVQDSYITSGSGERSNTNYGNSPNLVIGGTNSDILDKTLIQFKTNFEHTVVNEAALELYCTGMSLINTSIITNSHRAFHILSPWNKSTITTSNAPNFGVNLLRGNPSGATVNSWWKYDITNYFFHADVKSKNNGLALAFAGASYGWNATATFASTRHANTSIRPKLTLKYLKKPVIGFHNGTRQGGTYYSDGYNDVFKLLDFGTLTAGQLSSPRQVYVQNLAGYEVNNLRVYVDPLQFPDKISIELSHFNSPFIPESALTFNGTFSDGESALFYVRVVTREDTMAGGDFNIYAKADPWE